MKRLLLAIPLLSTLSMAVLAKPLETPKYNNSDVVKDIATFDLTGKIKPALSQMLDFIAENEEYAQLSVGEAIYEIESMIDSSPR
jgi:hypothetical protein